ncbi:uncharacterized protein LOC126834185 [Adelges cooleyi]|uniref:uncharacterized protein LOC126834185 n=1 Tax=Adelges cooleyi TaxID=133065 RepID=UPI0021801EE8|nr:uncharacterized protein LOC126834185 [Adelges cooleyi]XP_050421894.1 uncharacterized protein LOC126834185 [Adelges cooleyi]
MKHFCVLISFVVVNVLADKQEDYKREIGYTNRQIERVPFPDEQLQIVIRKIVCGKAPMTILAYMFAAPAIALEGNYPNYEETLQQCIDSQIHLQEIISKEFGVSVPEKSLVRSALRIVGLAFDSTVCTDYDDCLLTELENERTNLTREATRQLLYFVSNGEDEDFNSDYNRMCRLRGLYRSILYPDTFIILAEVVDDKCHLTGIDNEKIIVNCRGYVMKQTSLID